MSIGLYFHIPYCIQKCHYCDFTTFSLQHEVSMAQYTKYILHELRSRAASISQKNVATIYFGGGTPSLLPAKDILTIRQEISSLGFNVQHNAEITIEINPGTVSKEKLDLYLAAGVNRFSVGVQTFNDQYLQFSGREHCADDSRTTLAFLAEHNLNFSFDLLFGLPEQTLNHLDQDLAELIRFSPSHVSLYNLTVPDKHFMNKNRAPEEEQADMFDLIDARLSSAGIKRYELSNFARPGFESQHNLRYWTDQSYWGLGVSAHSYLREIGPYGTRFWNSAYYKNYAKHLDFSPSATPFWDQLPQNQLEPLTAQQALTDFCHTQLRLVSGLDLSLLEKKFGDKARQTVEKRVIAPLNAGFLKKTPMGYTLSAKGRPLANQVFLEMTFLPSDSIFT